MSTEIALVERQDSSANPISKEEIAWVKGKHSGLLKNAVRILREAMEIGQWFLEAVERTGYKTGGHGGLWCSWLCVNFPEIHIRTIRKYMQLARNRDFIEAQSQAVDSSALTSIDGALRLLAKRDRKAKQSQAPVEHPSTNPEDPLLILRDELKSYVYQRYQDQYLEEKIQFRIENAKLAKRKFGKLLIGPVKNIWN